MISIREHGTPKEKKQQTKEVYELLNQLKSKTKKPHIYNLIDALKQYKEKK